MKTKKIFLLLNVLILLCISLNGQSFTSHATIDQEFCGHSVLVVLDNVVGGLNRSHSRSLFGNIEIVSFRDLTEITGDPRSLRINEATFNQILKLTLPTDDKENVLAVIEQLRFIDGVRNATPNYIVSLNGGYDLNSTLLDFTKGGGQVIPNDPMFDQLWGMTKIQAPEAWTMTTGSLDVKVGIIDTGIASHPDLDANVVSGWNFWLDEPHDPDILYGNHGTHVAGTVGAVGDNDIGVVGVNWNVTLVPMRIDWDGFNAMYSTMVEAITWGINQNIPILNMSFSGFGEATGVRDAIENYPGLFVWSAGNDNENIDEFITAWMWGTFDLPNLISVGATTPTDQRSYFSNYGATTVNIYAPGSGILSTVFDDDYASFDGTSMAAPHVAGVAALMLAINPDLPAEELKNLILISADRIVIDTPVGVQNVLRLNAEKALLSITSSHFPPRNLTSTVGSDGALLSWSAPFSDGSSTLVGYNVYDFEGVLLTASPITTIYFEVSILPIGPSSFSVTAVYSTGESIHVYTAISIASFIPNKLSYSIGSDEITLSWEEPIFTTGLLGYNIYRGSTLLNITPTNLESFTDTNVTFGLLDYSVVAVYAGGVSEPSSILINQSYFSPRGLSSMVVGDEVQVTWEKPLLSVGITGYKVYRDNDLISGIVSTFSFNDDEGTQGYTYFYTVTAMFSSEESLPSVGVVTRFGDVLLPPRNIHASTEGNNIRLDWDAPEIITGTFTHALSLEREFDLRGDRHVITPQIVAHRFTPEKIYDLGLAGGYLTKISYGYIQLIYWNGYLYRPTLKVWMGGSRIGDVLDPGILVHSQVVNDTDLLDMSPWATVDLSTPISIPVNQEIWVGVEYFYYNLTVSTDHGPAKSGYGNLISYFGQWELSRLFGGNTLIIGHAENMQNSSANFLGYNVYRNGMLQTSVPIQSLSWIDQDVPAGVHTYQIYAIYDSGESIKREISIQKNNPPRNLLAIADDGVVNLSWNAPLPQSLSTFSGYIVHRNGVPISSLLTSTDFVDNTVVNGVPYTYHIIAYYTEPISVSGVSNEVTITLQGETDFTLPPRNLTAHRELGNISLTWSEPRFGNETIFTHTQTDTPELYYGSDYEREFTIAQRFTPEQLTDFEVAGLYLNKISFMPAHGLFDFIFKIWTGGSGFDAGTLIYEQLVSNVSFSWVNPHRWDEVYLDYYIKIPTDKELWIGYYTAQGGFPASIDFGPPQVDFGNLYFENGVWRTLGINPFTGKELGNWMLKAHAISHENLTHSRIITDSSNPVITETAFMKNTNQTNSKAEVIRVSDLNILDDALWGLDVASRVPASRNLKGYNVYRDGVLLTPAPIFEMSFMDSNLPRGEYVYGVTALFDGGESVPVEIFVNQPAITEYPYIQDISEIPLYWTHMHGYFGNPLSFWIIYDNDFYGGAPWSIAQDMSYVKTMLQGLGNWLISPEFIVSSSDRYVLSLDIALSDSALPGNSYDDDVFKIIISTDNGLTWTHENIIAMFDNRGSENILNNFAGENIAINFENYSGSIKFAFYAISPTGSFRYIHLSNITVSLAAETIPTIITDLEDFIENIDDFIDDFIKFQNVGLDTTDWPDSQPVESHFDVLLVLPISNLAMRNDPVDIYLRIPAVLWDCDDFFADVSGDFSVQGIFGFDGDKYFLLIQVADDVIVDDNGALSVTLSSFTATVASMSPSPNINIEWITTSETNMRGFHVFRSSLTLTLSTGVYSEKSTVGAISDCPIRQKRFMKLFFIFGHRRCSLQNEKLVYLAFQRGLHRLPIGCS